MLNVKVFFAVCISALMLCGGTGNSVLAEKTETEIKPIAAAENEAARLVTYKAPEGVEISGTYTVKARPVGTDDNSWVDLDVYRVQVMSNGTRKCGMVYFDCDGPIEIQVTCIGGEDGLDDIENGLNDETAVYPESYNIDLDYEIGGKVITLVANPNQTIVLDPNGDTRRNLQIWACDMMNIPAVEDVKAQGKTVAVYTPNTKDIPKSCDADVVYIKPGYYDADFVLNDNQTYYLEGGAVIHGNVNMSYTTNAKLIGRGIIYRSKHEVLTVSNCTNAYIEGIMGLNYGWGDNGGYFITIGNSKNVYVKNLKSIARHKWGDCMDIFCSSDVTVEGCFFRGNDDCIAIYGPRWVGKFWGETGNVRNIKVERCVLMPDLARPIHFGTHGDSASPNGGRVIDNCRFRNIDILTYNKYAYKTNSDGSINRMPQAIQMDVDEGNTVSNVYFEDIRIRDYMANSFVNLFISTQGRYGTYTFPGKGINNIYFKDIDYRNTDTTFTSRIEGYGSDGINGVTQNITFENVKINGVTAKSTEDIHANVGSNVSNIRFTNSGESKYVYDPSAVPEDIWQTYYDYVKQNGVTAFAEESANGSSPAAVLDGDSTTAWYSPVSESSAVYNSDDASLIGKGLTIDLGTERFINCIRIAWSNSSNTHSYAVFISKDGTDWSAGHTDEFSVGAVNSKADAERNVRVKSIWLTNQYDPVKGREKISGRYVKIIPKQGTSLDISRIEILGEDTP